MPSPHRCHRDAILDQFTRQAVPFSTAPGIRDEQALRAMPLAELVALYEAAGLPTPAVTCYELPSELEGLRARAFPDPGDADAIRDLFERSLADDGLGAGARRLDGGIHFAYPVAILAPARPSG